ALQTLEQLRTRIRLTHHFSTRDPISPPEPTRKHLRPRAHSRDIPTKSSLLHGIHDRVEPRIRLRVHGPRRRWDDRTRTDRLDLLKHLRVATKRKRQRMPELRRDLEHRLPMHQHHVDA